MMARKPLPALERGSTPWLIVTALAVTIPHTDELPIWLSLAAAGGFMAAFALWRRGAPPPGRWLLTLAVVVGCAGILVTYRTLLGRDAGVAMLVLFMALKLLEMKSRRDAHVVVTLAYFLLLTHYFYSQSIATGVWLLAAFLIATASLVRLYGGPACSPKAALRRAGLLTAQAIPFMVILYLLFPRVAGPLWGLPQDANRARSGLPDRVAPGSIADLVLSGEIAFRVRFENPTPDRDVLYWRGPVFEQFDGTAWQRQPVSGPLPAIEVRGSRIAYESTLEPHQQVWLLALDAPLALPPGSQVSPTLSAVSGAPIRQRQRFRIESATDFRFNPAETDESRRRNLALPPIGNPRARALAAEWRSAGLDDGMIAKRALELFSANGFVYTLKPPLLGRDGIDDFLFSSRQGFCEHYASAFAFLMRAAGIPSRVVGGYQGGEANPVDGYWVVRQSDAHAWAEVWLPGRGWTRIDPTAAVAPARVESGVAAAVPAGDPLPALVQLNSAWLRDLRYRWEAVNNAWNQYVLGYNPDRQRELLSWLGLPDADWRNLVALLAAGCGLALLGLVAWALASRAGTDPALRLWQRGLARLARRGVVPAAGETPLALARRLTQERPELAGPVARLAKAYCATRYGPSPDLGALRAALAALR
ncbi:MAG TPA: DUF3488 and transglutaminase-like domain-containing protein [Rhodocyclaceae bacterium]|jgi:transglutaminase-like putative cysteine protease|nr:DUF3488 and transglutaminase-like domain-containing protein [Rhodocyclaceae bacterium]HMV19926.1 DUF3488 and transglutaminase-like domain-containing protein [Rhodocyclaceae bacterium]HNE42960.1 DUF3488 and transglutaminase-like domain-containing protein [Rhodocyclaceae bacterium]HNM21734.1 DUF3488 and transglutaminase-like domain-containing protein [Rhodocyclaceae bacterium]HNM79914.1 DUF3488 and transglutaminase-like domain-containing protein [Rhodocyclaceae bacterium]